MGKKKAGALSQQGESQDPQAPLQHRTTACTPHFLPKLLGGVVAESREPQGVTLECGRAIRPLKVKVAQPADSSPVVAGLLPTPAGQRRARRARESSQRGL